MKKLFKKSGIALLMGAFFTVGSVVYAMANIPAACAVPGDCAELTPALQNVSLEDDIKLTDADGSNYVGFQSAATVATDTTWTLPAADGTTGQVLSTDGSGILSWVTGGGGGSTLFSALTDTDFTGLVAGALAYFDGTNWLDLAPGIDGQKLAYNDTTNAPEWVTDSTSSEVLSYLLATKIGSQTITSAPAGTTLEIDTTVDSAGTSIVNNGTGQYTLTAGKTYKLSAELELSGDGGEYTEAFTWYDVTGATAIGAIGNVRDFTGDSVQHGTNPVAIFTPSVDSAVEIQFVTAGDANLDNLRENSSIFIQQLPTTAGVGVGGGSTTFDSLTDTDLTGLATGALNYYDGTDWVDLGIGAAGQSLVVNGGATAPEWVSASSTPLERGSSRLAVTHDITSTGGPGDFEDIGVSVTLPKAGTYELKAMIAAGQVGDDQYINAVIADASNAAVSEFMPVIGTTNQVAVENFFSQGTATIIAEVTTTTDNEVFKIRVSQNNNTALGEINAGTTLFFDQKPTATVIAASDTPVNDQATSGYMDIGEMRIQWGRVITNANMNTYTFPAPFKTGTASSISITVGTHNTFTTLSPVTITDTTFNGQLVVTTSNSSVAGEFSWQAIGLRP